MTFELNEYGIYFIVLRFKSSVKRGGERESKKLKLTHKIKREREHTG